MWQQGTVARKRPNGSCQFDAISSAFVREGTELAPKRPFKYGHFNSVIQVWVALGCPVLMVNGEEGKPVKLEEANGRANN